MMKLCITTAVNNTTGKSTTGIFQWTGKSWRTATIVALVREFTDDMSRHDQQRAYREELKKLREAEEAIN